MDRGDALVLFLLEFCMKVCVVTETHLRDSDILDAKRYFLGCGCLVADWKCRCTGEDRIRGGELILIGFGLPYLELPEVKLPGAPLDACAPAAFPSEQQGEGYRITGMYCPPSEASLLKTKK